MSKKDKNEQVVIALFGSDAAANSAVDALKSWDKANDDIKLGSIGTITKDGDKVKTHLGHKTGKGATVGVVLGIIAAVLSGGITLLGGLVGGAVLGALGGSFFKKSGGLTKEEIQKIGAHLDSGGAAVVVSVDPHEVNATAAELTQAGGKVRNYEVPSDTVKETSKSIDHTGQPTSEAAAAAPAAAAATQASGSDDDDDDVVVGVDDEGDIVATDAEGDVAIEDIEGDVAVEDAAGDVAVEDVEGDVAVEDAEGDVAVSIADADDLTQIEGIGPETQDALYAAGIVTYAGLSECDAGDLHDVINAAGLHAPLKTIATWPTQATYAAAGDWDGMKADYERQK